MFSPPQVHATLKTTLRQLSRGFDALVTWVTQLSWWKFFLFATLALMAASILQDELFSSGPPEELTRRSRAGSDTSITIDDTGIHFNSRKARKESAAGEEIHIELPPQLGEELSNALEAAIDDAAEQKVSRYHRQASTWFKSFVSLLVLALFATKALMGGKKRAEAETLSANAAAERAFMQRQLSEAKMQMMQAQVEPHFLFNTLASVEHLIETDPPRAAAMQGSLIKYLRAVLPQMRDSTLVTNLGREADMVAAYLALLKMRMEERLAIDFDIPDGLRSAAFPPMMLQSLVENAIKHGLESKPQGGTLKVRALVAHNQLQVVVIDDGLGFGAKPSTGTGLGLGNIRERLKLLHGADATLRIEPNAPSGVVAIIAVPYRLADQRAAGGGH